MRIRKALSGRFTAGEFLKAEACFTALSLLLSVFLPAQHDTSVTYRILEDALHQKAEVQKLSLRKVSPQKIEEHLAGFDSLKRLELVNCKLTEMPAAICGMQSLVFLNLGNNDLDSIPSCICDLPLLEQILLWDNNINALPDCLNDMPLLTTVDLIGMQYNQTEQDLFRERFPRLRLKFSEPCDCNFE